MENTTIDKIQKVGITAISRKVLIEFIKSYFPNRIPKNIVILHITPECGNSISFFKTINLLKLFL